MPGTSEEIVAPKKNSVVKTDLAIVLDRLEALEKRVAKNPLSYVAVFVVGALVGHLI
jgi:hypothetical protein